MESLECVIFEDSSEFASCDEFGWNVSPLNNEKKLELYNYVKMTLSPSSSDVSSSVSGDEDVSNKVLHDDKSASRQEVVLKDKSKGNKRKVLPNKPCNSVSDNDIEEFPAQELVLKNVNTNRNGKSRNLDMVGGKELTSEYPTDLGSTKNKLKKSVISSSGHQLKPEELVDVDSELYAADDSEPTLCLEDLTSDEEVWLMQCPNTVNPQMLKAQKLLSSSTSRISVGESQVLEVSSHTQCPQTMTLVVPSRKDHTCHLVVVEPAGQILIREHIDIPQPTLIDAKKRHMPFPVGLKVRHPLLGSDYEKEFEQYNNSMKRRSDHRKQMKRKKRKRDSDELGISATIEGKEEVRKRKKIKLFDYKTSEDSLIFSALPESQVSHKKEKISPISEDSFVYEGTDESNVANPKKKKKHKRNSQVVALPSMPEKGKSSKGKGSIVKVLADLENGEDEPKVMGKNKKKKMGSVIDKVKLEPVDDLFGEAKNIDISNLLLERSKGCLMATDRDTAGAAGLIQTEKKKKKKRNSDDFGGTALRTDNSVIGISVEQFEETKKQKEQKRSYRFTIPANFGSKHKSASHTRKLSLNFDL